MNTYSFDDIARYAEGEMGAEERFNFEKALADDASLQQQLALYREVHVSLQQHFTNDVEQQPLLHTLQDMRGEFFQASAKQAKVVSMKRYLRSAMAVAAIFIAAILIWKPWQTDLYNEYAATEMLAPVERGENMDTLLQNAALAFNKKDFTSAAQLLQVAARKEPENSFVRFYYGVSLMQTGRLAEARNEFNQLFAGESAFKYEAAFYQALTYLKEKNKTACREWLEKIPADAGEFAKAQELLKRL
jgi:predicted Zn-dependent protease